MSALPSEPIRMNEAEYLEFERQSDFRHEYVDGEVFAMAGASDEHNLIVASITIAIGVQLRGGNCKIYSSDMRVRTAHSYYYPDVMVVCGERILAAETPEALLNPTLIIEVLSPSTEGYDRGKKFDAFQKIESLQEYILVVQTKARVERFVRSEAKKWSYEAFEGLDASLELKSINARLKLSEVYEQVDFP